MVSEERVLHKEIVLRDSIVQSVRDTLTAYPIDVIVLGNGTGSDSLARSLESALLAPIEIVEESFSTLRARARYFKENPPRGIRKLIPQGLLTPDCPFDDYVAVILAGVSGT